jgi:hypothetical protein
MQENNMKQTASRAFLAYSSTLKKRQYGPPKCLLTFTGLHGAISQKIQLFMTTALRPQILYKDIKRKKEKNNWNLALPLKGLTI